MKKAENYCYRLNEQLAGVTNLNQFGAANNVNVGEATQVKFANPYVSGIGLEPYIVGASMYLPVDQDLQTLDRRERVIVISVTNRTEPVGEDIRN